jgi:ParB family chromosome partitioning protein
MAALSIEKTQLSRLLSVGRAIPADIAAAIGSAPRAGRPRWQALADLLSSAGAIERLRRLVSEPSFRELESDARFLKAFNHLSMPLSKPKSREVWTADDGSKILRVTRDLEQTTLVVDERLAPEFGSFLIGRMAGLYQEFRDRQFKS